MLTSIAPSAPSQNAAKSSVAAVVPSTVSNQDLITSGEQPDLSKSSPIHSLSPTHRSPFSPEAIKGLKTYSRDSPHLKSAKQIPSHVLGSSSVSGGARASTEAELRQESLYLLPQTSGVPSGQLSNFRPATTEFKRGRGRPRKDNLNPLQRRIRLVCF